MNNNKQLDSNNNNNDNHDNDNDDNINIIVLIIMTTTTKGISVRKLLNYERLSQPAVSPSCQPYVKNPRRSLRLSPFLWMLPMASGETWHRNDVKRFLDPTGDSFETAEKCLKPHETMEEHRDLVTCRHT